jgi:cell division septation protein DedD
MPSAPGEAQPAPKPKPKPKPPAGGGAFAVQIGASPSVADAQRLAARFKKKFAAELGGLTTAVATVQVDGKAVNRVLVSGLASSREANGFCKTLEAAGQACFVRR